MPSSQEEIRIAQAAMLEAALLGGIMVSRAPHDLLRSLTGRGLEINHFFDWRHRALYSALAQLHRDGDTISVDTVYLQLEKAGNPGGVGVALIGEVALNAGHEDNLTGYVDQIILAAHNRKAIGVLSETLRSAQEWPHAASELIWEARGQLENLENQRPRPGRRTYDTVWQVAEDMRRFQTLPWVSFGLGGEILAELPAGESAVVMGPPGGFKTTLSLALAVYHAKHNGPVLVVSRELANFAIGARLGAMTSNTVWSDVLRGHSTEEAIAALTQLPRLVFLSEEKSSTTHISRAIRELKEDFPGQAILLVYDYLQLADAEGGDPRSAVNRTVERLRKLVKDELVTGLLLSQMSRNNAESSRRGEKLGADAASLGAETANIERAAALTFTLGKQGPVKENGARETQLSLGKHRYGAGDRVIDLEVWGASGMCLVVRDQPAAKAREQDAELAEAAKLERKRKALLEAIQASPEPMTQKDLFTAAGVRQADGRALLRSLMPREIVELQETAHRSSAHLLWTPSAAAEAGKPLRGVKR